jgi:hypothetical protein
MDRETRRPLEACRKQAGEVENTLIDEFAAGEMFGLSVPLI